MFDPNKKPKHDLLTLTSRLLETLEDTTAHPTQDLDLAEDDLKEALVKVGEALNARALAGA